MRCPRCGAFDTILKGAIPDEWGHRIRFEPRLLDVDFEPPGGRAMKAAMGETAASARAERLRAIPLLAELSDESLSHVLDIATEFGVERGHVLVDRGQPGTGLFVLEEGRMSVELPGRTIELGTGEFFRELALLDERAVRTARVSAAIPSAASPSGVTTSTAW